MGLSTALTSALSGLKLTQTGLEVVAGNVANADTPGYTRKAVSQSAVVTAGRTVGVTVDQVNRQLDAQLQARVRTEATGGAYTALLSSYASRLDGVFGAPGGSSSLDTLLTGLSSAFDALATTPESQSARLQVLSAAGSLARQLNTLSDQVQGMREEAETGLASATASANGALQNIARLNEQIMQEKAAGREPAALLDQRDGYVDTLAGLLDIRVTNGEFGSISIATASGLTLFDRTPATLAFDARANVTPEDAWSADPDQRSVGTLTLTAPNGQSIDLFASGAVRSGSIAAYRDLRDNVLVEAQSQLDEIAHGLALAMSTREVSATAAANGAQQGLAIDLSGLQSGNMATLDYAQMPAGESRTVRFVRVDDPASLPLPQNATADPDDLVVGLDFSGGMGGVASQIQAALGGSFTVSNPSGNTIEILDDGAAGFIDVTGLSAGITATGLKDGATALPLFSDGITGKDYTGSFDGGGQKAGFAARIAVNPDLEIDPSALVVYSTSPATATGDPERPSDLLARLDGMTFQFAPVAGIGSRTTPFEGSVTDYVRQVLDFRGAAAQHAGDVDAGQQSILASLSERLNELAAVNIDSEIALLVQLQTSYSANARVMTAVKDMLDTLMRM